MLAMVVNDNAGTLMPPGVIATIASKLAPTRAWCHWLMQKCRIHLHLSPLYIINLHWYDP